MKKYEKILFLFVMKFFFFSLWMFLRPTFHQPNKIRTNNQTDTKMSPLILFVGCAQVKGTSWFYITIILRVTADLTSRTELTSGYKVHQSSLNAYTSSDRVNSHKCHFQFVADIGCKSQQIANPINPRSIFPFSVMAVGE